MEVLALTLFISLLFAIWFLFLFVRERRLRSFGSAEGDALIPFREGREIHPAEGDAAARAERPPTAGPSD